MQARRFCEAEHILRPFRGITAVEPYVALTKCADMSAALAFTSHMASALARVLKPSRMPPPLQPPAVVRRAMDNGSK